MLEKAPPSDATAERAVLACIMLDPQCATDLMAILAPDDFYYGVHSSLYKAMSLSGGNIDSVSMAQALAREIGDEESAIDTVAGLTDAIPSSANAVYYARRIKACSFRRRLIEHCSMVMDAAFEPPDARWGEVEMAQWAETALHELTEGVSEDRYWRCVPISEVVTELGDRIDRRESVTGVRSYYRAVDRDFLNAGFRPGHLNLVAARPSCGKTTFAVCSAVQQALNGNRVAFFSAEMDRAQLAVNMTASQSGVPNTAIDSVKLGGDEPARVLAALETLHELPIFIDDTPGMTLARVCGQAKRLVRNSGVNVVWVDYLQLLEVGGSFDDGDRLESLRRISRGLKVLAGELSVPVIALAQLNRDLERRTCKRPTKSDLKGCGDLEQDADVILLLHRPGMYDRGEDDSKLIVICDKNRNGPTGDVELVFDAMTTTIRDPYPRMG